MMLLKPLNPSGALRWVLCAVSMWSIVDAFTRVWEHTVDFLIAPNYFDERTQDWPLASWKAAASVALLYTVAVPMAKRFMRDRKPLNVRPFAMAHNLLMAALSLYMVVETLSQQYYCEGWDKKGIQVWGSMAEPGTSFSPHCYRLARIMWIHYLSKVYEFTDTFIMIAKKNFHQVSFLHMYHHATTMLCWWTVVNFAPGGDTYFTCLINSWVHVVMYSYYFVASTGLVRVPSIFKQCITIMQMIQFSAFFSQAAFGVFIATYYRPRIVVVLALWQAVVFTLLFGNFFWHTYIKKRRPDGKPKSAGIKTPSPGVQADLKVQNGKRQGGSEPLESGKLLNGKVLNGKVPNVKAQKGEASKELLEPLLK